MKDNIERGKPGRPPYDVSEQVYAFVTLKLSGSMSLTEAARERLQVFLNGDQVAPVRTLKGKYLEANFRAVSVTSRSWSTASP